MRTRIVFVGPLPREHRPSGSAEQGLLDGMEEGSVDGYSQADEGRR